jgi:DnaJ homolog subfamily C member 19
MLSSVVTRRAMVQLKRLQATELSVIRYAVPLHIGDNNLHATRHYHVTKIRENPLIIGGVTIVVAAVGVQVGLKAYEEYQANRKLNEPEDSTEETASEGDEKDKDAKNEKKKSPAGPGLFSSFFATTFYDGGFEDKMTKREAALILGVRESATTERIKDAHRRILINNHPDRGGSPFLASKVNEAKDFLLKGKQ